MNKKSNLLALLILAALSAASAQAASYTVLHSFASVSESVTNIFSNEENSDGDNPMGGVVVSGDTIYGTAWAAGSNGDGTIFSIGTGGSDFTVLYTFSLVDSNNANGDGCSPNGLVLGGTTLYGTTAIGGTNGFGAVYSIDTGGGSFSLLYSFTAGGDGANPSAGLVLWDGVLYGTTQFEGGGPGSGTVFSIGTNGGFSTLHSFDGTNEGTQPAGPLTVSGSTLYGTTIGGGDAGNGQGTIFSIGTGGTGFTVLHTFSPLDDNGNNTDGSTPTGALVISGTTLYGTASIGGANGNGTVFAIDLTTTNFTLLHTFTAVNVKTFANTDGVEPLGGLILSGTTLYGTAGGGGSSLSGTVFSLETSGQSFKTLYDFKDFPYGDNPQDAVTLAGSTLYGTTRLGGQHETGTVFSLPATGSSGGGSGGGAKPTGVEVTIEPLGAVEAGAQWELDGGSAQDSASTATSSTGEHAISYISVPGWSAPASQNVSVKNNVVSKIKATYTFAGEGIYNGLFMPPVVSESTAGSVKITATKTGSYSGALVLNGATHGFNGLFNGALLASNSIPHTDISLAMTLIPASNEITGTVSIGSTTATLTAVLSNNHLSGEYTALLTPDSGASSNSEPAGDGYLLVTNHAGTAKIAGAMADGAAFSQSVGVSPDGSIPLFAKLYGGKGLVMGWVNLNNATGANAAWVYPGVRGSLFTSAFTATNPVLLSPWNVSGGGAVLPALTQLTFLGTNFLVTNSSAGKLTGGTVNGTINLKTGQIKVTDKDRVTGFGAVLLNSNIGGGYSVSKTGDLILQLNP